jgi:hypothetical protein
MDRPNDRVYRLWEMPRHEFDQWRRENDLPQLLAFFRQVLPHFNEWQSAYGVTDEVFLAATQPSKFFTGKSQLFLACSTGPDFDAGRDLTNAHFHDRALDLRANEAWQMKDFGEIRYRHDWEVSFTPFFHWLRTAKRIKAFPNPSQPSAYVSDFEYGRTEAYNTIFSRTFLFHSHRVLKLGGVKIRAMNFDNRNLDFVDLDHLKVSGGGTSWQTSVAYSSCRRILFTNYNKPFVSFEKCFLDEPRFENSHLERFEFIDCGLSRPVFQDTRLSRCDFRRSGVGQANFEKCDLIDLKVSPPKRSSAESLADFYKRLRVAFQSQGERGEASHFYYNERLQRLRGHVVPLIPRVPGLPGLAYSGPLITLYEQWQRGQMTLRYVVGLLAQNCVRVLKIMLYPPYFLKLLWEKLKVIPELFDWLVWGFGERPARVFAWMILAVGAFTLRYYLGTNEHLRGNLVASLSCSAYNFSTIGCDYRGRFDSMEAICGAVLLGIMVAGFSNRARY